MGVSDLEMPRRQDERNGRRDELEIMVDVLLNSMQTVRSTHILYKTNLGYNQMKKYLVILIRLGLIERTEKPFRGFRITQKGRAFIELLGSTVANRAPP